ncbi:MAG TPA: sigma-70 family RNA polymerase sigma factor [Kofleriaceae bacterium]|nr:sigma-70 family RNA polymerase sigma factor [Kofleriaceae bacterium]
MDLTADLDAMRALARSLVHGDPDAEDLVQDAALAALEHPPATDRPVRPWLATVLRNRWRMLYRGATRRAAREDVAVAERERDAAPQADDLLERARTLERLGAALVALEEPFRETVIRRYLDGESAAQIARALGVPAGTVRWRLKTGLDRLRVALDESSPRKRWQLALVAGAGVTVKTKSTSILVLVALLLLATAVAIGVVVLGVGRGGDTRKVQTATPASGSAPASGPPAPHVGATLGSAAAPELVDPLPGQGRAVVEPITAAGGAFAGRVINWSTGEGVAGAELTFSAGGDVITVNSGADGSFELATPTIATYALVSAMSDGFLPYAPEWQHSSVRLAAQANQRVRGLTVFLFPAVDYQGTVVDVDGKAVAGAKVRLLGSPQGEQALAGPATRWTSDKEGHFTFHAPDGAVLEAEHKRGRGRAALTGDVAITHQMVITLGDRASADVAITGRVVDERGAPEAGVLVRALPSAERPIDPAKEELRSMAFATSDADGKFTLAGVDDGEHHVTAEADDRAPAVIEKVKGGTRDLVLTLAVGEVLAGHVVDASGAAVPAFTLLVFEANGPLRELVSARSVVDARGRFSVHVDDGTYEVMASAPGWAPSAPTPASPGDDVTLRMSAGAVLRGKVVSAVDASPLPYARVMREARGGGASAQPANAGTVTRADGTFELTGIPPGPVSITIGAGGHHPRIEAGLMATEGAVLGPVTVKLKPLAPGETPTLELVGIGIKLSADPEGLRVDGTIPGGGAIAAGLVIGDHIVAVEGQDVAVIGLDGAIGLIRGQAGTFVRVTVRRDDKNVDISIERKPLQPQK